MFQSSVDIQLGDGHLTLFWNDRWNGASSPYSVAPDLCKAVKPKVVKSRTVAQALTDRSWTRDIVGPLTITALRQYIFLWHSVARCELNPGREDVITWRSTASGTYTARSAHRMFFGGGTRLPAAKPLWKAWAPLKVKFTIWLAFNERLWTADRRFRHRLQDSSACALCAQEKETCNHLFATCVITRQIWHRVSVLINAPALSIPASTLVDWWLQARRACPKPTRRGIDSTVLMVSWRIWKIRNDCVFNNATASIEQAMTSILQDASL
ncbi:hypothetical protein HU200_018404 [Digitaria exilis]|uniref:Reverse transcriptase zinc-binding domain-containing protein n=1 Tax=Digitaria exilis TaxID=1010633 RepID=A0A835F3Z5_9POAL|nr:hypothetical protein HU200_018404 [Digitaria exilis]